MRIVRIDHVQLAMPIGGEAAARKFYAELLGIPEREKPAPFAARGGAWFERGDLKLHMGVEADFRPAKKAHPALRVEGLSALIERLRSAGVNVLNDEPFEGDARAYVEDPFGNRIELIDQNLTQTG
jgi:catechol 2,3-dioxygenase-like lactoylglutathione lyase family enzyme